MSIAEQRLFVPEVVQSSVMDCGPAALKCLCEGFGIQVGYGRLREACQTDVDGTSIDVLETVAVKLGLDAEQVMLPHNYLFVAEAQAWPALVVVQQPDGNTHFVVVWRRHGHWLQVMDPGVGRRWITQQQLLNELYTHVIAVDATGYRSWAVSPEAIAVLRAQLERLGVAQDEIERHIGTATQISDWHGIARLDAATRMVHALFDAGALHSGAEASGALQSLVSENSQTIPDVYWTVRVKQDSNNAELWLKGAVLLRIRGRTAGTPRAELPAELRTALNESKPAPYRTVVKLLTDSARTEPVMLGIAIALLTAGLVLEALLLRALLNIGDTLILTDQRLHLLAAVVIFASALLALEFFIVQGAWRLGRRLELLLRVSLLRKIPRLHDRYFQSRLSSDMAERSHSTHVLRGLPVLVTQALRALMLSILTVAGIIWLDPASAPLALLLLLAVVALPVVTQSLLAERELRERTHAGGLARFYLDALLGLVAIRAHSAEHTFARQYESRVTQWGHAALAFGRAAVWTESLSLLCGLLLAAYLLHTHIGRAEELSALLLLAYWALQLPSLGQELVMSARQLAVQKNIVLRLIEPLAAPEESISPAGILKTVNTGPTLPVSIAFNDVNVRVAGHSVLDECSLTVAPGEHIAIVGVSGAGKSTLVGLLLGWYQPAHGEVRVNGALLTAEVLAEVRAHTAWVDPAVQLWNHSFLGNIDYGLAATDDFDLSDVLSKSTLQDVLARLPEGLQTLLGEGGALVSGGEGQRLRLARALARRDVRLAILDEPFRGLDREHRRTLLAAVREHWHHQTLLCVTHDLTETQDFARVLVIEQGRIIEDGAPQILYARADSRYRALLDADEQVRQRTWQGDTWRRLSLVDGQLHSERPHTLRKVVGLK